MSAKENPSASETERRKKLMNVRATGQLSAKKIACAGCGADLDCRSDTQTVICKKCRTVNRIEQSQVSAVGKNPKDYAPFSFVRLGMIGTFDGKKYEIVGRYRVRTRGTEWDDEDNAYAALNWTADEWLLVGEDGSQLFLYEDKDGNYEVSRSFVPDNPNIPPDSEKKMTLQKGKSPQRINERGIAEILFLEGEFSWTPTVGDKNGFAEYRSDGKNYSVEWSIQEGGKTGEVEFFESTPTDKLPLLLIFGLQKEAEELKNREKERKKTRRWAWACFALAAFLGLYGLANANTGTVIFRQSADIRSIGEEGQLLGPFEMKSVGTPHLIILRGAISDNSWNWAAVELLDADQNPINNVEEEFWHESGTDSDGPWTESNTEKTYSFRLDEAGTYYLRLYGEPGTSSASTVDVFVTERAGLLRYFAAASILLFLTGASVLYFKSLNPLYVLAAPWVLFVIFNKYSD